MTYYQVTSNTNPLFVLHNLVFSTPRTSPIKAETLVRELAGLDKNMSLDQIEHQLDRWYRDGMLNIWHDGYAVAQ